MNDSVTPSVESSFPSAEHYFPPSLGWGLPLLEFRAPPTASSNESEFPGRWRRGAVCSASLLISSPGNS